MSDTDDEVSECCLCPLQMRNKRYEQVEKVYHYCYVLPRSRLTQLLVANFKSTLLINFTGSKLCVLGSGKLWVLIIMDY